MLLTSVHVGARATFAPPASEPRISCRSSYHASNSAPHKGPTPGGYGGGRCSHSAVISPVSHNSKVHGHTVHTGPEERVEDHVKRQKTVHNRHITWPTHHKDPASTILEEAELCVGKQMKTITCLITTNSERNL